MNKLYEAVAQRVNMLTGVDHYDNILEHYYLEKVLGWPTDRVEQFFFDHDAVFRDTPVKELLRDMLFGLFLRNMNLYVVTHRWNGQFKGLQMQEITEQWLHKHHLSPFIKDIIYVQQASKYKDTTEKGVKLDVIVEDSLSVAKDFVNNKTHVVLFDFPYNQGFDHPLLHRVTNWWEAFKEIVKIQDAIGKVKVR